MTGKRSKPTLGSSDLDGLVADVERARAAFVTAIESLPAERRERPVGEGRWTPTRYLEHLVRAEEATLWRMFGAIEDWRRRGERLASPTPAESIEEIVERTWVDPVEAPPLAMPELGGSPAYWSTRLRRNRALLGDFADLVEESELDSLAYAHPISGPFTLRQALGFLRLHLDRHRLHVEEVVSGNP